MKLFQKTYPLVGMMLICGGILLAVDSEKIKVMQSIAEAQAKVFMLKDNIFAKKIKDRDVNYWSEMLGKIANYVNVNAGRNDKLFSAYMLCRSFGFQLINTILMIADYDFSKKILPLDITREIRYNLDELREKIKWKFETTS